MDTDFGEFVIETMFWLVLAMWKLRFVPLILGICYFTLEYISRRTPQEKTEKEIKIVKGSVVTPHETEIDKQPEEAQVIYQSELQEITNQPKEQPSPLVVDANLALKSPPSPIPIAQSSPATETFNGVLYPTYDDDDIEEDAVPLSPVLLRPRKTTAIHDVCNRCSVNLDPNPNHRHSARRRSKRIRRRVSCKQCGYTKTKCFTKLTANYDDDYDSDESDEGRGQSELIDARSQDNLLSYLSSKSDSLQSKGTSISRKAESWSEADRKKFEKSSTLESGQQPIVHNFVAKYIQVTDSKQVMIGDNCSMENRAETQSMGMLDFDSKSDPGVLDVGDIGSKDIELTDCQNVQLGNQCSMINGVETQNIADFDTRSDPGILDDLPPCIERLCSRCNATMTDDDKSDYFSGLHRQFSLVEGSIISSNDGSYDLDNEQLDDFVNFSSEDSLEDLLSDVDKPCPHCGTTLITFDETNTRKESQCSSEGSLMSPTAQLTDEQKKALFDCARQKIYKATEENRKRSKSQPFVRQRSARQSIKKLFSKRKEST